MSQTKDNLKRRFIDTLDAHEGYPDDTNVQASPSDYATTTDETVMYCKPHVNTWGIMDFADYSTNEGWSVNYAQIDDSTVSVYVFETGSSWAGARQIVIDADKLEAVADLLDRTPADVADSVQCHRTYPVAVDTADGGTIVIAPVANADLKDD